jgi:hypothetical protein
VPRGGQAAPDWDPHRGPGCKCNLYFRRKSQIFGEDSASGAASCCRRGQPGRRPAPQAAPGAKPTSAVCGLVVLTELEVTMSLRNVINYVSDAVSRIDRRTIMNRNIPPALADRGVALKSTLFVVGGFFVVALARPEPAYAVNWNVGVAWTTTTTGANVLEWRLFECTPPACRNPTTVGQSLQNPKTYTRYTACLDGRAVPTYIEGPFAGPNPPLTTQYKITLNGQSSTVNQICARPAGGFAQCTVSTSYTGDFRFCSGTPQIPN